MKARMSRRGNYWDNAVAESFFSLLKKERIKETNYKMRDAAHSEVCYNRRHRHSHFSHVSLISYEMRFLEGNKRLLNVDSP